MAILFLMSVRMTLSMISYLEELLCFNVPVGYMFAAQISYCCQH